MKKKKPARSEGESFWGPIELVGKDIQWLTLHQLIFLTFQKIGWSDGDREQNCKNHRFYSYRTDKFLGCSTSTLDEP
jgi:hypothetical protein